MGESSLLKQILEQLPNGYDFSVSDDEYTKWKDYFEDKSEHEKVSNLLNVLSQFLTSGCSASASVLANAIICTTRWCDEKEQHEFLNNM